jgi:glycosyltransferase involved in cell wall biosynthesis
MLNRPGAEADTEPDDVLAGVSTAVLIPCFNEAAAIADVVRAFRAALPHATIFVFDNNSTDGTAQVARAAGAVVRSETRQGKGHVVRRMFADIDADIYILVDGDGTYDAAVAPAMARLLVERQLDMVNAARIGQEQAAYRRGHALGNRVLTGLVAGIFGRQITDMLSGYRAFSRRFVKSFPALATGFETETEFTVHALEMQMPVAELPAAYRGRPPGGASKLRTIRDGLRILATIVRLVKEERPLAFFSGAGGILLALSAVLVAPVLLTYLQTGLVPRLPTFVAAMALLLAALLSFACGLILDSVARARKEAKRLRYLALPAPQYRRPPGG